ncbi:hypothetical protein O6H91_21G061700 [Diphasiastrum complanatum]|nr:hypothetical protein O6H91_21G061700 [Diphasiastrum complanatum]
MSTNRSNRAAEEKRVAVCLVGAARAFELTGPSIKKYVLDVYDQVDVFLHAPLDENSYKFQLLKGHKRLASLRIFKPNTLPETQLHKELLASTGSPNGIQGLLQYFSLVEGCWDMITKYENEHIFKYQWIIRTRVDGYWSGPLPPLEHFINGYYFVPYGSQFGGFNDRLGIGDRSTSQIALARLSLLSTIHHQGYRKLNSESAFKAQLESAKIKIKLEHFSFCVLSFRKYDWPLSGWDVPVVSISSKGHLNGAKCRPCTPKLTGHEAKAVAESLQRSWSWPGPVYGLELCDAQTDWERNWENIFDKAAGREIALIRKASLKQSKVNECIQQLSSFSEQWDVWDAPSPNTICTEN